MGLQEDLATIQEYKDARPEEALKALRSLVLGNEASDAEALKAKEAAINDICGVHVKRQDAQGLAALLVDLRPLFNVMPKVRNGPGPCAPD